MARLTYKPTGPNGGDGTRAYKVEFDDPLTVGELIDEIKADTRSWGIVSIKKEYISAEYRYGEFMENIPAEYLDREIKRIQAAGGWSRMDYSIILI